MKPRIKFLIFIGCILGGMYAFNFLTLNLPALNQTKLDNRNDGISYNIHYQNVFNLRTIVFDLKEIPSEKSPSDVFRVFLQAASGLKDKLFDFVEISYKGNTKFIISGEYYSKLGNEYTEQNPLYTMRTFTENLYDLNHQQAYDGWSGGILGVLGKQMEDFSDFNHKWYIDEYKNQ